ncbi:MAG TPA: hypothetical protein PKA88_12825 [Polyangiaceae bacterium]|nr:hypothetical protein [Polyangiaceae bacterium]HMR75935.1 hypothetical protein [Polyangiaceae bacterium]
MAHLSRQRPNRHGRRAQRGAALAEATVIASTMVVILASMWYAFDVHARKVKIMEETRHKIWPVVLNYCEGSATSGGGGGFLDDVNNTAGQSESDAVDASAADNEWVNSSGYMPADKGYYEHRTEGKVAKGLLPIFPARTQEARMYIRCNEKPKIPDGFIQIIKDLGKTAVSKILP